MRARKWTVAILAGTVILAMSGLSAQAQTQATLPVPAKPAAVVNGEPIPLAEIEAVLKAQGPTAVKLTEAQKRQAQYDVLEMLMDDLLFTQFLRKNAPAVTPAEVAKQLAELEDGLKKEKKTIADFLKETNQTEAQLRTTIVKNLQWTGYARARVSDADLKRYYDDNKDFFDRILLRVSHIVLRNPPTATEAEKQVARNKLLALRQEIVTGKVDFAEAAKKNSQCPSAADGGDFGYIPRKFMVDESFAKAAYSQKVGEISDVVQTEFGLHLIKTTERKPGQPSDFAKIKEDVQETIMEEMRRAVLVQQRKAAKIEVNLP